MMMTDAPMNKKKKKSETALKCGVMVLAKKARLTEKRQLMTSMKIITWTSKSMLNGNARKTNLPPLHSIMKGNILSSSF